MRFISSLLTLLSENNSCHKLIQFLFDFFHSWFLVIFSDFVFFLVMKYSFHHSYVLIFNETHKNIQIKYIYWWTRIYIEYFTWCEEKWLQGRVCEYLYFDHAYSEWIFLRESFLASSYPFQAQYWILHQLSSKCFWKVLK